MIRISSIEILAHFGILLGGNVTAIKAFRSALANSNAHDQGAVWLNIGILNYKLDKTLEAEDALRKAMELRESIDHISVDAKSLLQLIDAELKIEALSPDDRAMLEQPRLTGSDDDKNLFSGEREYDIRILNKLQEAKNTQYEKYLKKPSSQRDNIFSILRGWSSAVTLLEGSERLWRGGGYLLKWQGKGIVIDPGLDFLRNLHDAGYHGREIDAVLVSHNHSDHNGDLINIDDLRYEIYQRRKSDIHGKGSPYTLIWDGDSHATIKFASSKPQHQYRPILLDLGRCKPEDTIPRPKDMPFSVTYFEVEHGDNMNNAVGFRLILHENGKEDFIIGYTGDTEFFPELADHLKNCDILLAHISQPDPEEFINADHRKKIHLGYRGLADLVELTEPKLTLVGEFWAGLADLRIDLVQGLRQLSGTNAILPAGIGLHISVPDMCIECSECKASAPYADIRVAPPANQFGNLSYLCANCLLY